MSKFDKQVYIIEDYIPSQISGDFFFLCMYMKQCYRKCFKLKASSLRYSQFRIISFLVLIFTGGVVFLVLEDKTLSFHCCL